MFGILAFLFLSHQGFVNSLDNGLALTPPMGWLTWERFRCITICEPDYLECINETLILKTADLMVSDGYLDAGYEYVGIDDCWLEMSRDENGRLVPDKKRFPRGMKFIADYLHSKGLKLGIYEDFGTKTCAGYPGSLNHLEIDAQTFGEWEVDYVKLDGCYVDIELMDEGYPKFGELLNKTGRPMLYSCSWPVYQEVAGMKPNFTSIMKHCNMWRNYYDIQDSWSSIDTIMEYFGKHSKRLATYAGPGHWNDPDMLLTGNFGLSFDQSKTQLAVWAILAAPLLMSTDLKAIKPEFKELLLNKEMIAVNQDKLGRAGIQLSNENKISVWSREISPIIEGEPSRAIAFVNRDDYGAPRSMCFDFEELSLNPDITYITTDVFPSQEWKLNHDDKRETPIICVRMNPSGVVFLKFTNEASLNSMENN